MSAKSDYKKVSGEYGRKARKNEALRAKENQQAFDNIKETEAKRKKASAKKRKPRSDHKHEYETVLVKTIRASGERYHLEKRCTICGILRYDMRFDHMWEWVTGADGRKCYKILSNEEILEKYKDLTCVEISE